MPTNKARTSDNAQKQSASNAIPIFYSDLLFCSLSNKSSSSWSRYSYSVSIRLSRSYSFHSRVVMVVSLRPALRKSFNHTLHHVPTTYLPPFQHISTSYCFRIVSASGSENDRRTIGERYGINTGLIRERYENNTRTVFSDSHPKLLIRNLIFLSLFLLIIFYISTTCLFQLFMPRRRAHHLPWRSLYTKITFRSAECKPISMN